MPAAEPDKTVSAPAELRPSRVPPPRVHRRGLPGLAVSPPQLIMAEGHRDTPPHGKGVGKRGTHEPAPQPPR